MLRKKTGLIFIYKFILEEKCDLLNKYFSFISKLDEANAPLPDIDLKTNIDK
jgi:hypothetical protein